MCLILVTVKFLLFYWQPWFQAIPFILNVFVRLHVHCILYYKYTATLYVLCQNQVSLQELWRKISENVFRLSESQTRIRTGRWGDKGWKCWWEADTRCYVSKPSVHLCQLWMSSLWAPAASFASVDRFWMAFTSPFPLLSQWPFLSCSSCQCSRQPSLNCLHSIDPCTVKFMARVLSSRLCCHSSVNIIPRKLLPKVKSRHTRLLSV